MRLSSDYWHGSFSQETQKFSQKEGQRNCLCTHHQKWWVRSYPFLVRRYAPPPSLDLECLHRPTPLWTPKDDITTHLTHPTPWVTLVKKSWIPLCWKIKGKWRQMAVTGWKFRPLQKPGYYSAIMTWYCRTVSHTHFKGCHLFKMHIKLKAMMFSFLVLSQDIENSRKTVIWRFWISDKWSRPWVFLILGA